MMIEIDRNRCVSCGRCAEDCFRRTIVMSGGAPVVTEEHCMECGHCVAICPHGAVSITGYDMSEAVETASLDSHISPEVFLAHLRTRRTIRQFKREPVPEEKLRAVIEAGRLSPTGGNRQNVAYHISRKGLAELRSMAFDSLRELADEIRGTGSPAEVYAKMWIEMHEAFRARGEDRLCFGADTVIVVSSDSPQSAIIAAAHMETMVYCQGLGMLYSGFLERAIARSPELRRHVGLKDGWSPWAVLVIGIPDVSYVRTVPRKPADTTWN